MRLQVRRSAGARTAIGTAASVLVLAWLGASFAPAGREPSASAATLAATAATDSVAPFGIDGGSTPDGALPTPVAGSGTPTPPPGGAAASASPAVVPPGGQGIPARVLVAYRNAAAVVASAEPGCHLRWQLLAGIGRIESDHAWLGDVRTDGTTVDLIVGPALDGSPGGATVHDTDRGRWDGDPVWDHAVGPMQFIPTTWAVLGRDGDGDGVANPNDVDDATVAAGFYLCRYGRNLDDPAQTAAAVHSYNHSDAYVAAVLAWAQAYTDGTVTPVPGAAQAGPVASGPVPSPQSSASSGESPPASPPTTGGVPNLPGPVAGGQRTGVPFLSPTPSASPTTSPTTSSCPSSSRSPTSRAAPSIEPSLPTGQPSSGPTPPGDGVCPTPAPTGTATALPSPTDVPSASGEPAPSPTP